MAKGGDNMVTKCDCCEKVIHPVENDFSYDLNGKVVELCLDCINSLSSYACSKQHRLDSKKLADEFEKN